MNNNQRNDNSDVNKINQYIKLINKLASKFKSEFDLPYDEKQDLKSEGIIAVLNALKKFDPSRGVKESTYIYSCIENAMKKYCIERGFIKPSSEEMNEDWRILDPIWEDKNKDESIDKESTKHNPPKGSDYEMFISQYEKDYERYIEALNPEHQKIIKMLCGWEGKFFTRKEVSEILNISTKKIRRIEAKRLTEFLKFKKDHS